MKQTQQETILAPPYRGRDGARLAGALGGELAAAGAEEADLGVGLHLLGTLTLILAGVQFGRHPGETACSKRRGRRQPRHHTKRHTRWPTKRY